MNVLIRGQERTWTKKLTELCRQDQVYIYEEEEPTRAIALLVTDFPVEEARKGIFKGIPFLVVSKEKKEEKILEAFKMGAEDYMIYPVSPKIARVRIIGILKRYGMEGQNRKLLHEEIYFTPNEYRILSCMMAYPKRVFSRGELIEEALKEEYEGVDRNIDNYIRQIRKKLEEEGENPEKIQTVYGVGYRYLP